MAPFFRTRCRSPTVASLGTRIGKTGGGLMPGVNIKEGGKDLYRRASRQQREPARWRASISRPANMHCRRSGIVSRRPRAEHPGFPSRRANRQLKRTSRGARFVEGRAHVKKTPRFSHESIYHADIVISTYDSTHVYGSAATDAPFPLYAAFFRPV